MNEQFGEKVKAIFDSITVLQAKDSDLKRDNANIEERSTCIMANTTNPRRNAEGYSDPTAYEALKNIEREEDERFHRLLHTLFYLCELADFEIEGRIILVDKRNGRVWR